jgi:L-amino acid N-acyltransferase YncA
VVTVAQRLELRLLQARELDCVAGWFDDESTRMWVGGREWAARALSLAARLEGRFVLLALLDGEPVGVLEVERRAERRATFTVVVASARRGRGVGAAMLRALFDCPQLAGVRELFSGVEQGNLASERMHAKAGFAELAFAGSHTVFALDRERFERGPTARGNRCASAYRGFGTNSR